MLGRAHWTTQALLEAQLDHLTELATDKAPRPRPARRLQNTTAIARSNGDGRGVQGSDGDRHGNGNSDEGGCGPGGGEASKAWTKEPAYEATVSGGHGSGMGGGRFEIDAAQRTRAETRLCAAVLDEAGLGPISSAEELLRALWWRTSSLWEERKARRESEVWESLVEVLEALEAWGVLRAVLASRSSASAAHAMVAETRARSEMEYGPDSTDAQKLRALEATVLRLIQG